jgi:hypothetical protein
MDLTVIMQFLKEIIFFGLIPYLVFLRKQIMMNKNDLEKYKLQITNDFSSYKIHVAESLVKKDELKAIDEKLNMLIEYLINSRNKIRIKK